MKPPYGVDNITVPAGPSGIDITVPFACNYITIENTGAAAARFWPDPADAAGGPTAVRYSVLIPPGAVEQIIAPNTVWGGTKFRWPQNAPLGKLTISTGEESTTIRMRFLT